MIQAARRTRSLSGRSIVYMLIVAMLLALMLLATDGALLP